MGIQIKGDFKRQLDRVVKDAVRDIASDYQRMFDSLGRRYKGRPVAVIKPVLRREWKQVGGDLSDPELTDYATLISNGTKIKMRTDR